MRIAIKLFLSCLFAWTPIYLIAVLYLTAYRDVASGFANKTLKDVEITGMGAEAYLFRSGSKRRLEFFETNFFRGV